MPFVASASLGENSFFLETLLTYQRVSIIVDVIINNLKNCAEQ